MVRRCWRHPRHDRKPGDGPGLPQPHYAARGTTVRQVAVDSGCRSVKGPRPTNHAGYRARQWTMTLVGSCHAVPDGERCVQSNRRPHKNARESRDGTSVYENCRGGAVIQQHRRDQPAQGEARSVIARQPAGAAQREQRSAGDTATMSAAGASSGTPNNNGRQAAAIPAA